MTLEWLNDLMVWLARWVPRLQLIKAGHEGVLFAPGGRVRRKAPGLCIYWPITHELTLVSTRVRTTQIAAQLHGLEAISIVVLFRISNAVATLLKRNDVFSTIDDRAQAHLALAYRPEASGPEMCRIVRDGLIAELSSDGVDILSVDIAQRGRIVPIKLLNDYASHAESTL